MFCLLQLLHLLFHITSLKTMEVWTNSSCFFFKGRDTRIGGRLQYAAKEEPSPLNRQWDFGWEILINNHVRTQTDSEPELQFFWVFSPSPICNSAFTCSGWLAFQWDRGSDGNKIPSLKFPNRWNLVSTAPRKGKCNQLRTCQLGKNKSTSTDSKAAFPYPER